MVAYVCRNCKEFTILGFVNEYNEHFCTKECYEAYCKKHEYGVHWDKLLSMEDLK